MLWLQQTLDCGRYRINYFTVLVSLNESVKSSGCTMLEADVVQYNNTSNKYTVLLRLQPVSAYESKRSLQCVKGFVGQSVF